MNQGAAAACARTAGSSAARSGRPGSCRRPRPRRAGRPAAAARPALRPRAPSRSGTRTKSFSVPWPLVNAIGSAMVTIIPDRPASSPPAPPRRAPTHAVDEVGAERVDPPDARVGAEPAPGGGRAAGCAGPSPRRRLLRRRPVEHIERLGVADRPARGAALAQPAPDEAAGLLDQARVEHRPACGARCARRARRARGRSPTSTVGRSSSRVGIVALNGRPVSSTTSRARTMRRVLPGSRRRRRRGSRRASSASRAGVPSSAARRSSGPGPRGRWVGSRAGRGRPGRRGRSPRPAAARRPRARTASTSARASRW